MTGNGFASGRRCLVVEDEFLVAMLLEDTLRDLGFEVLGPVATCAAALALVRSASGALDAAVLDVNLGGERVYPVADALRERGVPFVFLTGYAEAELDGRFANVPVVQKPWLPITLEGVLARTFTGDGRRPVNDPRVS